MNHSKTVDKCNVHDKSCSFGSDEHSSDKITVMKNEFAGLLAVFGGPKCDIFPSVSKRGVPKWPFSGKTRGQNVVTRPAATS